MNNLNPLSQITRSNKIMKINWKEVRVITTEKHDIKKAVYVRRTAKTMNRDEGAHQLISHEYIHRTAKTMNRDEGHATQTRI